MEVQLNIWGAKIDKLAARTQVAGVQARFDEHIYVDELKALLAIARAKLDEFTVARQKDRARIKTEMKKAWNELEAALSNPMP